MLMGRQDNRGPQIYGMSPFQAGSGPGWSFLAFELEKIGSSPHTNSLKLESHGPQAIKRALDLENHGGG